MPVITESPPFVIDPGAGALPAYPENTILVDGRAVSVWQETAGGDVDVKAKILNADGSVSVPEFTLSSTTVGNQFWPVVAGLANGGFVAIWWDQDSQLIRSQAFSAAGTTVGGETSVRSVAGNPEAVALALTGGNYVLGSNSGWQVFAPNGLAVTPLTTAGDGRQIVALNDGGFGVVSLGADIYLQTYSASGVAGAAITLIDLPSTPADPDQPTTAYTDFQVVQQADGGFSVAYIATTTIRHLPPYFSIRLDTISASGQPLSTSTLVAFPNFETPHLDFQLATNGVNTLIHYTDAQGEHLDSFQGSQRISLDAQAAGQISWGGENDITALHDGGFLITSTHNAGVVQGQIITLQPDPGDAVYGTEGADVLTGTSDANLIHGAGGNDVIIGNGGVDDLFGDDGDDLLVSGPGASSLYGGNGDDTYEIVDSATYVIENPAKGYDAIHTSVDLTLPDNVEALVLTDGAVNGAGNALDNVLTGNALDNNLQGLDGNDTLYGGDGQDQLYAGAGDDLVHGQSGNDQIYGWIGADLVMGGSGNDAVYGEDGADTLFGEDGVDALYGGTGNDFLAGQEGADALWGEAGEDFLYGGAGADQLIGQAGADVFYYGDMTEGGDNIIDFNSADGDRIIVNGAAFGAPAGFQLTPGLGFLSGPGVTPTAATATFYYDTTSHALWYDIDGVGAGQGVLIAQMASNPTLHASDFIFV
ncbi:calcium-binding protein [Caulobacter sp.]|uniref:calcium-binding protein n=1 Tax=Caulobacter sp. TaxID=78 RepID=UPI003BAE868E